MKFKSVFEIIGPTMIGPSSSHTAGAVRIAMLLVLYSENCQNALIYICMAHLWKLIEVMVLT